MKVLIGAIMFFYVVDKVMSQNIGKIIKESKSKVEGKIKKGEESSEIPTESEVIEGLKEALKNGAKYAVSTASKEDGFYKNERIFIPFPPEAQEMKEKLIEFGFGEKVNEFEKSLNRAAEKASKDVLNIFIDAIVNMSISDAMKILKGDDTAATSYLRKTTYNQLYERIFPIAKDAIEAVEVTKYWKPLVSTYNSIPGVKKKYNPDLDKYVTTKTIDGLFILISDEEKNIRKNPAARVSDILKKVFSYAEKK